METTAPSESAESSAESIFSRFRQGLKRTSQQLNTDIRDLFKQEGRLVDEQFLKELYAILVRTDMGTGPAAEIRDEIGTKFRARVVHMPDVLETVKGKIHGLS